ncbi:hypothetical protein JCM11641_000720 [Rhodosporidiobolus odoratus]
MAIPKLASSASLQSLQAGSIPSTHPLVDYVLLAEFDIDQGSVLKHQYPQDTGCDQHLLAEHMLPDGAHDRQEDWTVFCLNQVPGLTLDTKAKSKDTQPETGLYYVMSLVRTKMDAAVRRGALVKALAVVTRNPYIQIFKPILLLALEDYFNDPSLSVLSNLYQSLNSSLDLSTLPHFSLDERTVLRTSDRKDLFEEKFPLVPPAPASAGGSRAQSSVKGGEGTAAVGKEDQEGAQVLVASPTSAGGADGSASSSVQGGFNRSPSLSSLASIAAPSPSSVSSTDDLPFASPSTSVSTSATTIPTRSRNNTLASIGTSSTSYSSAEDRWGGPVPQLPQAGRSTVSLTPGTGTGGKAAATKVGGKPKDTHYFETLFGYGKMSIPVRIPLATWPGEVGEYSLINLISTFSTPSSLVPSPLFPHLHTSGPSTPPIILLFNALLTGQRVVFLGHGQPAGKVAELVLAAVALVTGCGSVLQGIQERAFPYTNLANLDNLQNVDGFIAGVCNPAFADRPSWWDVLCNIETGKITVSKDLKSPFSVSSISLPGSLGGKGGTSTKGETAGWNGGGSGGGADEFGNNGGSGGGGKEGGGGKDKGESADQAFMDEILHAIAAHYGESVIRARFTDYVSRFVRLASKYEEDATWTTSIGIRSATFAERPMGAAGLGSGIVAADEGTLTREVAASAARIEAWNQTASYKLCQQAFRHLQQTYPIQGFDLAHQISRLRQSRQFSPDEARLIFQTLAASLKGDEQVIALLAHLPSHFGGLVPLAFGFFHPSPEVRHHTLELFDQLSLHPTGRKFVNSLNAFHRSAYARLASARDFVRQRDSAPPPVQPYLRTRESTVTLNSIPSAAGVAASSAVPLAPPVPMIPQEIVNANSPPPVVPTKDR